ncbi:MAG: phosphotransferase [Patescibacteria group bacterium]
MKDIDLICKLNKDWRPDNIKIKKAGGQTNRNFIVQHKNKKFFVRLPWETSVIDRNTEGKNILALSRNKKLREILPKYYIYILRGKNILSPKGEKFNLPDGTMVAEYILGRIFTASLFKIKKYQERLARMFYVFHTSGARFNNKYNVFRDEIEKYRVAAKKYPIQKIISPEIIENLNKIEKEAALMVPIKKRVPAHNDFIFQNFLTGNNGKIYLLDFEYAGMSEKGGALYDFAFLFADNLFRKPTITKELFEKFLRVADKIYRQSLDRNQIWWLVATVAVMQVWWGLLRYFDVKTKKEKKYFKDYVLKRAKGILDLYKIISKKNGASSC